EQGRIVRGHGGAGAVAGGSLDADPSPPVSRRSSGASAQFMGAIAAGSGVDPAHAPHSGYLVFEVRAGRSRRSDLDPSERMSSELAENHGRNSEGSHLARPAPRGSGRAPGSADVA